MANTICGTVRRCNGTTVLLDERDEPLVLSRFARNLPTMEGGDRVELTLDGRDFVTGAIVLNDPLPAAVHGGSPDVAIRQAALTAAATFCASRHDLKSADLFALAERMEGWITR